MAAGDACTCTPFSSKVALRLAGATSGAVVRTVCVIIQTPDRQLYCCFGSGDVALAMLISYSCLYILFLFMLYRMYGSVMIEVLSSTYSCRISNKYYSIHYISK